MHDNTMVLSRHQTQHGTTAVRQRLQCWLRMY